MAASPKLKGKKKEESDDDDELDVDTILRDPIVLQCEVQLFTKYVLPTADEGGILCGLPPGADKPWRVEMSSEMLTDGGVTRLLRISRRGVMFFCDGDIVESSVSLGPVTLVEAVYENSLWEPADGYVALDTVPLDRLGHPPADRPAEPLLIMRMPTEKLPRFETLAVIFGKCTKKSARKHRESKPISIVARHSYKNEMTKYAVRLAEEEEARKKLLEEGGEAIPEFLKPKDEAAAAAADEAKKKAEGEEAAKKKKREEDELEAELEKSRRDKEDEGGSEGLRSPTNDSIAGPGFGDGEEQEQEQQVVYSINPFSFDLFHTPEQFNNKEDEADVTALDAERMRQKIGKDSDAELYTKTRALYFGSPSEDRSTAAVDALGSLLSRGRERVALGSANAAPAAAAASSDDDPNAQASSSSVDPSGEGAATATSAANPLDSQQQQEPTEEDVSPSRLKSLMTALSYREATRVQKPQLDAFFADAEVERIERAQKETKQLTVLLRDLKVMTQEMDAGFRKAREMHLSGMSAPRRRTPPWLKPEPPKKPPTMAGDRMRIPGSPDQKMLNPFSQLRR